MSYCIHIHVVTSTDTGLRMDSLLLGNDHTHVAKIVFFSGVGNGILFFIIIILYGIILVLCGKNHFKNDRKPR